MPSQQLQTIVQMLRAGPSLADMSIPEMRATYEAMAGQFPLAPDLRRQTVDAGGVPAEWISAPGTDDDRTILYLHGGGYVIGSIGTHREMVSRIARAAGARALLIDYRLAPEHPFPAAVEDATAAYRWLLSQGAQPERLVVAGDSAGGGLTLAALVALRDGDDPLPAAAVCISPWTDLAGTGESMTSRAEVDPLVQPALLQKMAEAYLAGADPRTPLASPLYADLRGLPPLLVQVGTSEVLLDDSTRLVEAARAAGVEAALEPWQEMIHVWHYFALMLPEGQQAIERIGQFVRERTG